MKKQVLFFILSFFLLFPGLGQADYKEMCKFLVDLPGWSAKQCSGMQMSSNFGVGGTAIRTYSQGEKKITAMLTGGNMFYGQTMGPLPQFQQFEMNVENKFIVKTLKVNGYKVVVSYDKEENVGGIVVFLKEKDLQKPVVFILNYEHMGWEEALDLAKKFDWDSMKDSF
jgi:hypothetical protein